jgi:8-oxo-dGTP pyrophosphatase MutT (NUDIX family)
MERVGGRVVYTNPWMTVREDTVRRLDGSTGVYGVVEKDDFALVVPRGPGGFWLVEQYRYPIGRRAWEFPQGGWSPGTTGDAADLARAELSEETGVTARSWRHLGHLAQAYGVSTQGFDVWLAEDLTEGEPHREATEADMVHRFVADAELEAMIRCGAVVDGASLAALTLLPRRARREVRAARGARRGSRRSRRRSAGSRPPRRRRTHGGRR